MEREEILKEIREYFQIEELVCPHVAGKWCDRAWQFLATDFLHNLLVIRRDILRCPMTCNSGTLFTQRGLRCNCCELVSERTTPYLSAHLLGRGADFSIPNLDAHTARQMIEEKADLLPFALRMEGGVSWLHIDTLPQWGITKKVYTFKP